MVPGGTPPTLTTERVGAGSVTAANVCTSGGVNGFIIYLSEVGDAALDEQEVLELQSLIIGAIKNPFENAPTGGTYADVIAPIATGAPLLTALDNSVDATVSAGNPSQLPICLE